MRLPRSLCALLLVLWAQPAQAAVSFVSAVTATDVTDTVSTLTLANVVGSGGNVLLTGCTWRQDAGETIASVTYGGSATGITLIHDGATNEAAGALYYLVNPAGTADVVVTFSANTRSQCSALVLSGVDTASPLFDTDEGISVGTSVSLTLSNTTDGLLVDMFTRRGNNEAMTPGADQTERSAQSSGAAVILHRTSTQPATADGVMSWSWATGSDNYLIAVTLAPSSAAVNRAPRCLLLSVCE